MGRSDFTKLLEWTLDNWILSGLSTSITMHAYHNDRSDRPLPSVDDEYSKMCLNGDFILPGKIHRFYPRIPLSRRDVMDIVRRYQDRLRWKIVPDRHHSFQLILTKSDPSDGGADAEHSASQILAPSRGNPDSTVEQKERRTMTLHEEHERLRLAIENEDSTLRLAWPHQEEDSWMMNQLAVQWREWRLDNGPSGTETQYF